MAHKVSMHNEPGPVSQGASSKEGRIEDHPRNNHHSNGNGSGSGSSIDCSEATLLTTHQLNRITQTPPSIDPADSNPVSKEAPQPSRADLPPTTSIPLVVSDLATNAVTACDFAYKPARRFPHPLDRPPSIIKKRTYRSYQKALDAAARKKGTASVFRPPPVHRISTGKSSGQRTSAPIVPSSLHGQVSGTPEADASSKTPSEVRFKLRTLPQVVKGGKEQRVSALVTSSSGRTGVIAVSDNGTADSKDDGKETTGPGESNEGRAGEVGDGNGGEAGRRRKRDRFVDWVRRLY